MVTSRTTLELFYDLWPLYFQITSIWKERIEIGLLTPTNHTWGSSIAWSSDVKWPLFLVLAFPYGSCFPCLHSEGTKAELNGAGITAEPKHSSFGFFLFVFFCFHHLSANSGHLPSSWACWIQQVQLYQSWPLSPLVSSHLMKPLLQTRPASFPLHSTLATKAAYSCCGASFQPYISVHYLQPSGTWLCFSSWSLVSISAPLGPGFRVLWNCPSGIDLGIFQGKAPPYTPPFSISGNYSNSPKPLNLCCCCC